ncbi:hypothetical protein ACOMHN_017774 [Nucella lapillus]
MSRHTRANPTHSPGSLWPIGREVQDPGQVQDPSRSRGESELEEEIELSGRMERADQFERYLYGNPFLVQTDHSPLQYLDRVKSASGRITRWALLLQPFQFTIEAIPGKENVSADFLSRIPDKESVPKVRTVQGDVFSCPPSEALAHCVSQDLEMGAGIAVEFKARFGGLQELKKQGKVVGEVAVLKRVGRFVYYLVTKCRFHDRPTYKTLRASLEAMKRHCNANHVVRLSVPQIGCGIDGLKWEKVSDMLAEVFKDRTVTVTAYVL